MPCKQTDKFRVFGPDIFPSSNLCYKLKRTKPSKAAPHLRQEAALPPSLGELEGVSEAIEYFFTRALVAQLAVEAIDEAVLLRFARAIWCETMVSDLP